MRTLTAIILLLSATPAVAQEVCVLNGGAETRLFAAEARNGVRRVSVLKPQDKLCVPSEGRQGGLVSVFENFDHPEGCSRLVAPPGGTRVLLRYSSFDRCAWDDNTE